MPNCPCRRVNVPGMGIAKPAANIIKTVVTRTRIWSARKRGWILGYCMIGMYSFELPLAFLRGYYSSNVADSAALHGAEGRTVGESASHSFCSMSFGASDDFSKLMYSTKSWRRSRGSSMIVFMISETVYWFMSSRSISSMGAIYSVRPSR